MPSSSFSSVTMVSFDAVLYFVATDRSDRIFPVPPNKHPKKAEPGLFVDPQGTRRIGFETRAWYHRRRISYLSFFPGNLGKHAFFGWKLFGLRVLVVLRSENILNTYVRRALNKGEVLDHQ